MPFSYRLYPIFVGVVDVVAAEIISCCNLRGLLGIGTGSRSECSDVYQGVGGVDLCVVGFSCGEGHHDVGGG